MPDRESRTQPKQVPSTISAGQVKEPRKREETGHSRVEFTTFIPGLDIEEREISDPGDLDVIGCLEAFRFIHERSASGVRSGAGRRM